MTYRPLFAAATQAQLLAELRLLVDENYLGGAGQTPTGSIEIATAIAAMFARAQKVVERQWTDVTVSFASTPNQAEAELLLTRTNTTGPLALDPGTVFGTASGRRYTLQARVEWPDGDGSAKTANVRSEGQDYQQNSLAGEIDRILLAISNSDTSRSVVVAGGEAEDGAPDSIGLVAAARGIFRRAGEDAESLRRRARRVGDVVSPTALRDLARAAMVPYIADPFDVRYLEGYDIGPAADEDCSDDPSTDIHIYTPLRSAPWFCIEVPELAGNDVGCYADDGASDYDCSDGWPVVPAAAYSALRQSVQAAKGGGVAFDIVRK